MFSVAFLLVGTLCADSYYFIQFISWGSVIVVFASSDGIQFDIKNNKFRHYKSNFGIMRGTWESLSKYVNVLVLTRTGNRHFYGRYMRQLGTLKDSVHRVYLADSTHRDKIELASKSSFDSAKKIAQRFEKELKLPLVKYSPQISQKTKDRRR